MPSVCFDGLYFVGYVGCGFVCGVVVPVACLGEWAVAW